jgi:hypothetical protein
MPSFTPHFDTFSKTIGKWKNLESNGALEFPAMLEAVLYREAIPADYRVILYSYLKDEIWNISLGHDLGFGIQKLIEFMLPCDDEIKLTRVIPLMATLAQEKSASLLAVRSALFGILTLLKSVGEIPGELDGYFHYLNVQLHATFSANQGSNHCIVFAEFLPILAIEMKRLSPRLMRIFFQGFTSLFTMNDFAVFKAFANSLIAVRTVGRVKLLKVFLYGILVVINFPSEGFTLEILNILIAFYSDGTVEELQKYSETLVENVLPIFDDIFSRDPSDELQMAIFEFFELLLRKNLVDVGYTFDWALMIAKCHSSANGILQYWIAKLNRLFPPDSRGLWFVFDVPTKVRAAPRVLPSKSPSLEGDAKLFGFDSKMKFHPSFVGSSRIDCHRIDFVISSEDRLIVIDSSPRIRWVDKSFVQLQTQAIKERPTACRPLPGDGSLVLGFGSGAVELYDIRACRQVRIANLPSRVTALDIFRGAVLTGCANGLVAIVDSREPRASIIFEGTEFAPVSDICVWTGGGVLGGFGFYGGAVSLFDLRMAMPIWLDRTGPVRRLLPMGVDVPGVSYMVMNARTVEMVVEPRNRPRLRYAEAAMFRWPIPFHGGAIVVDDYTASFVHPNTALPGVRLFDESIGSMSWGQVENVWKLKRSKKRKGSVHRHQGRVTCGTMLGDVVVTCDDLGFLNRWRVEAKGKQIT